jgi:hypothetical protein
MALKAQTARRAREEQLDIQSQSNSWAIAADYFLANEAASRCEACPNCEEQSSGYCFPESNVQVQARNKRFEQEVKTKDSKTQKRTSREAR